MWTIKCQVHATERAPLSATVRRRLSNAPTSSPQTTPVHSPQIRSSCAAIDSSTSRFRVNQAAAPLIGITCLVLIIATAATISATSKVAIAITLPVAAGMLGCSPAKL